MSSTTPATIASHELTYGVSELEFLYADIRAEGVMTNREARRDSWTQVRSDRSRKKAASANENLSQPPV